MLKKFFSKNSIENKCLTMLLLVSLLVGLFYPLAGKNLEGRAAEDGVKTSTEMQLENCSASLLLAKNGEIQLTYNTNRRQAVNKLNQWAFVYYVLSSIGTPRPQPSPTPTPSPSPLPDPVTDEEGNIIEGAALPETEAEPVETLEPTPSPVPVIMHLSDVITVTRGPLDAANRLAYHENIGLQPGDKITLENLIRMFILTQADDVRETIIYYVARSEWNAVYGMNLAMWKIGLTNTYFTTTKNLYNSGQYTTVADIYKLFTELMKNPVFEECIKATEMPLSFSRAGQEFSLLCTNVMYGDVLMYGELDLPEGWQPVCRLSGACERGGCAQLLFARDPEGIETVSVVGGIPFEKDVSIETKRFLELKDKYTDAKQELPLGDDTVRYKYLLDSDVEYYTVDNRAAAYLTKEMTDRYMMNLTVDVWQLNEATGKRYSAKVTIPIHRKVYQSLKDIMQAVYELPIQFPIKVFLGYNYRQSGGVGLSNCTLTSVHAYGAAVDINPGDYDNDYFLGKGNDLRDKSNPYCIPDEVIEIFERYGWNWGGNFEIAADTMHFQYLGLDYLTYQDNDPFVKLSTSGTMDVGIIVGNLQDRLAELGYNVNRNGIYNNTTRTALMKFQARNNLPVTGEVDYKTWETLINLTHYMEYVF